MRREVRQKERGGFTLLEIVLAMALLALLVGGAFGVTAAVLQMLDDVREAEEQDLTRQRFVAFCRSQLEALPASAWVAIEPGLRGEGDLVLGELERDAFPGAGGVPLDRMVLRVREGRLELNWLTPEAALAWERGNRLGDDALVVPLLDDVKAASWRVYDAGAREWRESWSRQNPRPGLVEFRLHLDGERSARRYVFWIPNRQAPEVAGTR